MSGRELSASAATTALRSDGVLAVDLAGNVIYVNQATELITGRARGDLLGHPLGYLFKTVDLTVPHQLPAATARAPALDNQARTSESWVLDRRKSLLVLVEYSAAPIPDRYGRIAGAIIVFREVASPRYCAVLPNSSPPTPKAAFTSGRARSATC